MLYLLVRHKTTDYGETALNEHGTTRKAAGPKIVAVSVSLLLFLWAVTFPVSAPAAASTCNPVPHAPVLITSDSDFTAANGVVSGSGAADDPYLIANLQIKDLTRGYAIKVDNSRGKITSYFKIRCIQSNFEQLPSTGARFIWIVNIRTPTTISEIMGNSQDAFGVIGVELDSSSNITLDSLSLNRIGNHGVLLNSSDHITLIHSKVKSDGIGVPVVNSHHITIGSPCDLASGTDCNDFTYDDERGILIQDSHDVIVQYTKTSADDGGGIIVDGKDSYNVTLVNGIASGNGPICRAVPITRTREPTGPRNDYISGIAIINGAHDITVRGYTIQGNAHFDIMNGGDGTYLNPCTGPEPLPITPQGGANLDLNGNCYGSQFGFSPPPTKNCPKP